MIELAEAHATVWKDCIPKLLFVISSVMKNNDFEDKTRESAVEVIVTMAEYRSPLLRKHAKDMKEHFFPALAFMMT